MILALATAYVAVAVAQSPQPVLSCDLPLLTRLGTVSVIFLVVAYAFVRVMVPLGLSPPPGECTHEPGGRLSPPLP